MPVLFLRCASGCAVDLSTPVGQLNIKVADEMMYLEFTSEGHEARTFKKDLIVSEYTTAADIPQQTQELFVPIGQNAYADQFIFFELGTLLIMIKA